MARLVRHHKLDIVEFAAWEAMETSNGSEAVAWLDRLGPTTRLNDPAIVRKSDEIFATILSDPAVTATAVVAAGSRAEVHGDLATAEKLYRRALKMEPGLWVAQNNLAITILHRSGYPKEATQYGSAAVKLQPKHATLRDTLAQAESEAGNAKAAADDEFVAIQLDPDDPRWRVCRARALLPARVGTDRGSLRPGGPWAARIRMTFSSMARRRRRPGSCRATTASSAAAATIGS
jgi:tetratricopeptide (TPR) repeat protein